MRLIVSLRGSPATNSLLPCIIRLSLFIKLVKQRPNSYVFSATSSSLMFHALPYTLLTLSQRTPILMVILNILWTRFEPI